MSSITVVSKVSLLTWKCLEFNQKLLRDLAQVTQALAKIHLKLFSPMSFEGLHMKLILKVHLLNISDDFESQYA